MNNLSKVFSYNFHTSIVSYFSYLHHQLNGHEFEQAPGVGDGQRNPVHDSPWGHKESDTTQ